MCEIIVHLIISYFNRLITTNIIGSNTDYKQIHIALTHVALATYVFTTVIIVRKFNMSVSKLVNV